MLGATTTSYSSVSYEKRSLSFQNVVFVLGVPGCGKKTQCKMIAREFNYSYLSVDELLIREMETGAKYAREIETCQRNGTIVSKEVTVHVIKRAMETCSNTKGFLIEGFPKDTRQAEYFEQEITACRFVLFYECSEETIKSRSGMNRDQISRRCKSFYECTFPMIQSFVWKSKCVTISAEASINEVYEETKRYFFSIQRLYHKNVVSILGGPGAGKATQCALYAREFKMVHVSIDMLVRIEMDQRTQYANEIEMCRRERRPIPSSILISLFRRFISKNMDARGFVLSDFPRNVDEAKDFENQIGPFRAVIYLSCSTKTLEYRSFEKTRHSTQRVDIQVQISTFERDVIPLVHYFDKRDKCIEISAEGSANEVFESCREYFILFKKCNLKNIVFCIGPKGTGKTIQCNRLSATFGYLYVNVNDVIKSELKNMNSRLSHLASSFIQKKNSIPVWLKLQIIRNYLTENGHARGFIFDDFPKTMEEALEFERLIGRPKFVFYFYCSADILKTRSLHIQKDTYHGSSSLDISYTSYKHVEVECNLVVRYYAARFLLISISTKPVVNQVFNVCQKYFHPLPFEGERIIFVMGASGSGKGTQCRSLEKMGYVHISVSQVVLKEIQKGFHLGPKLKKDMEAGKVLPIEVVMYLLEKEMEKHRNGRGYILNGFPMNLEQFQVFERTIGRCSLMLYLEASNDVLIRRVSSTKAHVSYQSSDNYMEVDLEIKKRKIVQFSETSSSLLKYVKEDGRFRKVNADLSVQEVTSVFMDILQSY